MYYGLEMVVKPCVGCGFCCMQARCSLSVTYWPHADDCPALVWDDSRYKCKFAMVEDGYWFREKLYIGGGCCSPMNSWRTNVRLRAPYVETNSIAAVFPF